MNNRKMAIWMTAGALLLAAQAFSQSEQANGKGRAVVTVLAKQHGAATTEISQKDVSIKVNGKPALVTRWAPLRGPDARLELVLLIDSSGISSLGSQFGDIEHFINGLPPNTKAAIAYMRNGSAVFAGPLTADHAEVLRALHLPGGSPGSSASPYFCLSELAKHWPSGDRGARREVVMVTNGVDNYLPELNLDDPYVLAAIDDSVRAGLVVYSIYWQNQGPALTSYGENTGQSLLIEVTEETGGKNLWTGMGNPVSLQPFFEELARRLENQYELDFSTSLNGKPAAETLKVKLDGLAVEVTAPKQVLVKQASAAE
ncbi:MAG TPA: hypothetical protein VGE85_02480 [Terracidiphilus sp.]|jgi:hypothetical protein